MPEVGLRAAMPRRTRLHAALLAASLALCMTAAIDAARVPLRVYGGALELVPGVYLLTLWSALVELWPSVLLVPALALVRELDAWRVRAALSAALGGLAVYAAFLSLARYPDFARYPPAIAAFVALGLCVAVLAALEPKRRVLSWLMLAAAAMCFGLDATLFRGDYPTLHVSLLQCGLLLGSLALFDLLGSAATRSARTGSRPALATLALVVVSVCVVGFAPVGARAPLTRSRPYVAMHTTLGQTFPRPRAQRAGPPDASLLDESRARDLFARHSGLPELPADFALGRYNVLLVLSEAFRADQSSLADERLGTTPELLDWSRQGGFAWSRAFSASTGTYQSLGGLFGMSYPSFLSLEIWRKPWTGRFVDEQPTVAELFQRSGYDTFWVGHDHGSSFSYTVRGYERGFGTRALISAKQSEQADADAHIARAAIGQLERVARGSRRFFGWVFLVSPHAPYLAHDPTRPAETEQELYRQELAFVDAQLGELRRALVRLQLLDDTIVIFSGDHGEEFGDHGGRHHKSQVYVESAHVPLVVWLPGASEPRRFDAPTSNAYVFPWLMQRGEPAMQAAAQLRLRRDFGPMIERTRGAVVVELLGEQRSKVSLVYPDRKYDYDLGAQLHEAFRDERDAEDLFERDAALTADARRRVRAYLQVRSERERFVLRPDVLDPRPDRQ